LTGKKRMNEEDNKQEEPKTDVVQAPAVDPSVAVGDAKVDSKKPETAQRRVLKNLGLGILLGLVLVAVVAVGVLTYGGYKKGWGGASTAVMRALSLPAASVDGQAIKVSDYLDDLASAKRFFAKSAANDPQAAVPSELDLRSGVLDRLIENVVLEEQTKAFKVTVTKEDLDKEFETLVAQMPGEDPAAQIMDLYGWTVDQFKEKVMRPYLLSQRLAEAYASDPSITAESEVTARGLLDRVKAGEDFAQLARENSDDPGSAVQDGDLGWFAKGTMVQEFEEAAWKLKPGEVSDLVKTKFGYHIIKLTDEKKDDSGTVTELKASHILVSFPDVNAFLQKKLEEGKVVRYMDLEAGLEETAAPAPAPAPEAAAAPEVTE